MLCVCQGLSGARLSSILSRDGNAVCSFWFGQFGHGDVFWAKWPKVDLFFHTKILTL